MATFNSANGSYQTFNKTLFETNMVALSNGHVVDSTNRFPVDIGNTVINISGNVNISTSNTNIYNSNGAAITNTAPLPVTLYSSNSVAPAAASSFEWQVALGNIPNATQVNIFGYSATISNTYCIAWENSPAEYAYLSTAQNLSANSTSASDDANTQILIQGLDSTWAPLSETITLNGTSVVGTLNKFLRVNSATLIKPGTNQNTNIGTITLYYGTTQLAEIAPQISRSQMSQYSVANGYTLYVQNINMFSGDAAGASKYMNFRVDVLNNVTGVNFILLHTTWQNQYQLPRLNPYAYPGKSDIRWQMATNSGIYTGSAVIEATLIRN